jgi:hypothetical protein
MEVLSLLSSFLIGDADDYQLTIGPARKEKTHGQRKLFHALCAEFGREVGYTPGQVKAMVKEEHFGVDTVKLKSGKTYQVVQSSEDADRTEYSDLIETLLRMAAENGVLLDTRRAA